MLNTTCDQDRCLLRFAPTSISGALTDLYPLKCEAPLDGNDVPINTNISCTVQTTTYAEGYDARVNLVAQVSSTKSVADFGGFLGANTGASISLSISGTTSELSSNGKNIYVPFSRIKNLSKETGITDGDCDNNPDIVDSCDNEGHGHHVISATQSQADSYTDTCTIKMCEYADSNTDDFYYVVQELHVYRLFDQKFNLILSGNFNLKDAVEKINWGNATVKTYVHVGERVFTFESDFGIKTSLLVRCQYGDWDHFSGGTWNSATGRAYCTSNPF